MGNKGSKSRKNKEPIVLNMGDQPMSMGFSMGEPQYSSDHVDPPSRFINTPDFIAKKEAQYAACMELIN